MHWSRASSHFVSNILDCYTMVFYRLFTEPSQSAPHLSFGWPDWACLTCHWSVNILKWLYQSLIIVFPHDIIAKGLLNILDSLSIMKLLLKLDAISAFGHLAWKRKYNKCALHIYTTGITNGKYCSLPVRKFSYMHRKVGFIFHPKDCAYVALVLVWKK